MKKLIMACLLVPCLFIAPGKSFAASVYDGIWAMTGYNAYFTINEKNGTLVFVFNDQVNGTWSAYAGQLNGNKVRYSTLLGPLQATEDVTFTSNTTATIIVKSCYPIVFGWSCGSPAGTTYGIRKIW